MIVIKPIKITDSIFTNSTVAEPDTGETTWAAGTYNLGDRRIKTETHKIYEVTADPSTADDPVGVNQGVNATPPTWVQVQATNKWALFDEVISTTTKEDTTLTVVLNPNQLYNAVAAFNLIDVTSVNVSMNNGSEVYSHDVDMNDFSLVDDWYDYFFTPVDRKTEFSLLDLPPIPSATLTLTAIGSSTMEFGEFVVGTQANLGEAVFGSGFALKDFSDFKEDSFGNVQYTPRADYKLVNFDIGIQKERLGYAYRTLKSLKGIPAVWVGSATENDETLVYGYYRDNNLNYTTPTICDMTIQIRGLT